MPTDIISLVLDRLPPHDVQATLLVCSAWSTGFSHGLVALRPRLLAVPRLAARFPALAKLDLSSCRGVGDADVLELSERTPRLVDLSLAGLEAVGDKGVGALSGLKGLTRLSVYNCCRVSEGEEKEGERAGVRGREGGREGRARWRRERARDRRIRPRRCGEAAPSFPAADARQLKSMAWGRRLRTARRVRLGRG